jgi:hypothetical protein
LVNSIPLLRYTFCISVYSTNSAPSTILGGGRASRICLTEVRISLRTRSATEITGRLSVTLCSSPVVAFRVHFPTTASFLSWVASQLAALIRLHLHTLRLLSDRTLESAVLSPDGSFHTRFHILLSGDPLRSWQHHHHNFTPHQSRSLLQQSA